MIDLIARRREMMGASGGEQWDYELYPYDGSEIGLFLGQNISVADGDEITILFNCQRNTTWAVNYIYDGRNGGTNIGYRGTAGYEQDVDNIITLNVVGDGTVMIGNINGATSTNSGTSFRGRYIKVRIN